uniref:NADH dehydrogenase subunit 4L n=1 Tax=Dixoniella grisea TaxID=35153 RepID=UPI001FCDB750|nr:NADH dehydrogenase subunit 4L [Dixoniella grisea]UNJ18989.1 NADH dehydrogenase subunit 4L [Dixoniella grisea]
MLINFLNVTFILFFIGLSGIFFNRKNILLLLMAIEIMLLAISCNWTFLAFYIDDLLGQLFSILILIVAAAEASLGLSILILFYRVKSTISVELVNLTKN